MISKVEPKFRVVFGGSTKRNGNQRFRVDIAGSTKCNGNQNSELH